MKHFSENPVRPEEKKQFTEDEFSKIPVESYYGTTLVSAVVGKDFTLGFQIGDGSLVAVFEDGETVMIMDYEESSPANITASMCNKNAPYLFNHFYTNRKKILALFVSTDGLYTSFRSDEDFLDYHSILANQLANINAFSPSIRKNLSKRAKSGTQDDTSLACVFDCEVLAEKLEDLKEQVEVNKIHASMRKAEHKARMEKQKFKNALNQAQYEENSAE